ELRRAGCLQSHEGLRKHSAESTPELFVCSHLPSALVYTDGLEQEGPWRLGVFFGCRVFVRALVLCGSFHRESRYYHPPEHESCRSVAAIQRWPSNKSRQLRNSAARPLLQYLLVHRAQCRSHAELLHSGSDREQL